MKTPFEKEASYEAGSLLSSLILRSQAELETVFSQNDSSQIAGICKYIIKAGGKRLRPLLTLLACDAVGGDYKKALPVSIATELAHTLALIQDDIFDQATLRRGVKPVHTVWGTSTAILASDYLFLKMVRQILKTAGQNTASEELTLKVLNVVVDAGLEAVEGEHLDLQLAEKEDATVEEWIVVAKKKTASLIQAALETGALIGGGTQEETRTLKAYGEDLGIAYQIVDDLLGLTGRQELVGKDIGLDITNKRMTVVTVHALQNSSSKRERILKIIKNQEIQHNGFAENLWVFEETGSIGFAQRLALKYAEKAVNDLNPLKPTEAKSILEATPTTIINRKW